MLKMQEKIVVCQTNEDLLHLLLRFGNGAMLLPQLRALALALGLYPNGQAVNRAVRELREADVLDRQTWLDNNSDLILARKYALRYFSGKTSQEIATPQRPRTMAPYILQARKVDWLLASMDQYHLTTQKQVEAFIEQCACSLFLRLPELPNYYRAHTGVLARENPGGYREQLARLEGSPSTVTTLEQMHRRGLYVVLINSKQKFVKLISFAGRDAQADRLMDWTIEAHQWVVSLLPYYRTYHVVQALDKDHCETLRSSLTAIAPDTTATPYWDYRLQGARLSGAVQVGVHDSNFIQKWCGGVHRAGI